MDLEKSHLNVVHTLPFSIVTEDSFNRFESRIAITFQYLRKAWATVAPILSHGKCGKQMYRYAFLYIEMLSALSSH